MGKKNTKNSLRTLRYELNKAQKDLDSFLEDFLILKKQYKAFSVFEHIHMEKYRAFYHAFVSYELARADIKKKYNQKYFTFKQIKEKVEKDEVLSGWEYKQWLKKGA